MKRKENNIDSGPMGTRVHTINDGATVFIKCDSGHTISVMGSVADGCVFIHTPKDKDGNQVCTHLGGAKELGRAHDVKKYFDACVVKTTGLYAEQD